MGLVVLGVAALAATRFLRAAGGTALVTALRWHVYEVSGEASALGWLGLAAETPIKNPRLKGSKTGGESLNWD